MPTAATAGAAWPVWCTTPTWLKQYISTALTERLAADDAYDSALAESVIGLYKTQLIKPGGAPAHR